MSSNGHADWIVADGVSPPPGKTIVYESTTLSERQEAINQDAGYGSAR